MTDSVPRSVASMVTAFLAATRFAAEAVSRPAVRAAWDQPSALADMTVGDVAGHLFLVVRRVDKHLDQHSETGASSPAAMGYPRVDRPGDLELEVHARVRLDARHVAAWGWPDLVEAYTQRVAKLEERLPAGAPDAVVAGGRRIEFRDYLGSRVVEVLVHADDLLVSTGSDGWHPPQEALDAALEQLLGAARRVHGDREVLRAFTRRERVPPGIPSVF